jgi:GT2 family glycosyltransferase
MRAATPSASVAALTVLYDNSPAAVRRTVEAFDNAARIAVAAGLLERLELAFGDASPQALFDDAQVAQLRKGTSHIDVTYEFFEENTGTSRGQNRLARSTESDHVLICNPDVLPEGRSLLRLLEVLADPSIALAEAKQQPIEHPKDYDTRTGDTSWGSGAFSLVRRSAFEDVGGFDEDTFFLYCDDVDLSWRLREAGHRVVNHPAAVVFHDKDLSPDGGWVPTEAERYFSAEAALLLAHKWSRDDILDHTLEVLEASPEEVHHRAVAEFRRRLGSGSLAPRRDPDHAVGQFVGGNYAPHRFVL